MDALNRKQFSITFAGRPLILEVSRLAEQANAAVLGTYGDTTVLVSVVMRDEDKKVDFFPLTVDYEERFYAAGKIIGSRFVRREGRPSEEAILSGRLIDRTIRPLFDHRLRRDVQVVVTILSIDEESDPDFIALLTASTALAISDVPWAGPVAGVKIMKRVGEQSFIINPKNSEVGAGFELTSFIAGTADRINMVEFEGVETPEATAVAAFETAQKEIATLIAWQHEIIGSIGKKKQDVPLATPNPDVAAKVKAFLSKHLEEAIYVQHKTEREARISEVKELMHASLVADGFDDKVRAAAEMLFEEEVDEIVHRNILEKGKRPDGRRLDEVRPLHAEVGFLKRTHGSALFMRGNTQALAVTTLGPPSAQQLIETIEFTGKKRFMLHYNFPAYSVGETGPFRGPGRREIGHGALASKALRNMIPDAETFPYTIRVVSEILSSNGSSSMATACSASLALMDAGVPIKKPVAGMAMGLMSDDKGNYKILTDIQGPEDHHGDMDFKAAGTDVGITAIQMDVKINGVTAKILGETLEQARIGRLHMLEVMKKALPAARTRVSEYAPVIMSLMAPKEKIGEIIGPGGKNINGLIEKTGVMSIDIEEDGRVFVTAIGHEKAQAAYDAIAAITKVYEIGEIIEGPVVKILEFGAIVEFGGRDGMIHVSELKEGFVKKVEDVLKVGDFVRAKIIKVEGGKIGLSLKAMNGGK